MEQPESVEPKKATPASVGIVVICVLLAAVIVGAITYAVTKKKAETTTANLQNQIDALKSEIPAPAPPIIPDSTASPQASASPTPTAVPDLTSTQLMNLTYTSPGTGNSVKLTDGTGTFLVLGSPGSLTILQDLGIATGDLDGDGVPDKAVTLSENDGGTGYFRSIAAILNKNGQPVLADVHGVFGDRDKIDSVTVSNGIITITGFEHGPNQSMADVADVPHTESYKLINNKLVAQ